jgi:hypothetical protein
MATSVPRPAALKRSYKIWESEGLEAAPARTLNILHADSSSQAEITTRL